MGTNQQSITGSDVTITAGDPVLNNDAFKATATDKTGKAISVTVDTSKVNWEVAGDYPVTLTSTDGQTAMVTAHVLANQQSIAGSDVTITAGDPVLNNDAFKATATDKTGKAISVTIDTSKVNWEVAGDYPVTLTSTDGQMAMVTAHVLANQQSITGSDVTITAGDPVPNNDAFKATATDKTGKAISVTVDTSKVSWEVAGDYPVTLTSTDGQIAMVTAHVLANQQSITGSDVTITAGDPVPNNDAFKATATDKTGKAISVTIDTSKVNWEVAGDYPVTLTIDRWSNGNGYSSCISKYINA